MSSLSKILLNKNGHTLIEVMIALLIIGICFIPLMQMYSIPLASIENTNERTTARYLASYQIETLKNLFSTTAVFSLCDYIYPAIGEAPEAMNDRFWRTEVTAVMDPLGFVVVTSRVFKIIDPTDINNTSFLTEKPVFEIQTILEDF